VTAIRGYERDIEGERVFRDRRIESSIRVPRRSTVALMRP
jgi:hypothetical protein